MIIGRGVERREKEGRREVKRGRLRGRGEGRSVRGMEERGSTRATEPCQPEPNQRHRTGVSSP